MYTKFVSRRRLKRVAFGSVIAFCLLLIVPFAAFAQTTMHQNAKGMYQQTNLVSDIPGMAPVTDPNLINPWGLVASATSPWWLSNNNSGTSTLYNGLGQIVPLVVAVPPPAVSPVGTAGTPTGIVFNGTPGFVVSANGVSGPSVFIFASEDGTISGWSPAVNRGHAITAVDRSVVGAGAVYKGLAIGTTAMGTFIYATNFRFGMVEMFNSSYQLVKSFTDPFLPGHYAPFGIQNIGGNLYVSFAKQNDLKHDDIGGRHHGFIDVFSTDGTLLRRLVSRGDLDSPWGMALAPANFGALSNTLLVGNFRNGHINAYDPTTGVRIAELSDSKGHAIVIDKLWGLSFGNGAGSGATNALYFTAGIQDEAHGLFGNITSLT